MSVPIDLPHALAIAAAGAAAGFINSIVGSGSLVSFPTLLWVGYVPRVANMSNSLGLVPGGAGAVAAQRRELVGLGWLLKRLVPSSLLGGIVGALLLLVLPASVFQAVVPFLILVGVALVIGGPALQDRLRQRNAGARADRTTPRWLLAGVFLTGVYGGYFGAAQGIILMGLLGIGVHQPIQRLNAVKNVLGSSVNLISALIFMIKGGIVWAAAGLLAIGAIAGGVAGSHVGRRIPPSVLRAVIAVVGIIAAGKLIIAG